MYLYYNLFGIFNKLNFFKNLQIKCILLFLFYYIILLFLPTEWLSGCPTTVVWLL